MTAALLIRAHRLGLSAALLAALVGCSSEEPTPATGTGPDTGQSADPGTATQEPLEVDAYTGLIKGEDWQLIAANCVICHSAQQFLRQRGTRRTWQSAIDWMQATQGMLPFPPGIEERIVTYLATHYGPDASSRRAPIPPSLMPPNPYASEARREFEQRRERGELPEGLPKKG